MARYTERLRNALDRINEGTQKRRRVYGVLGRMEADGTTTVRVAGDTTKAHVRVQGEQAATTAFHRGAVNLDSGGGQPVIMWKEDGQLHIAGYDPMLATEVLTSTVYARSDSEIPGIFDRFSSDTDGVRSVLYLAHITDQDMIDNFGVSIQIAIEDDAGVRHPVGFISGQRDGADDSGRLVFTPMSGGVAGDTVIFSADGTVQMAGYGAGVATFDANGNITSEATAPTSGADVASAINSASAKTTPVDADTVGLVDSADANALKKLSWANIKATLKTYFDTIYAAIVHSHAASDVTSGTFDNARIAQSNVTQHQGAIDHGSIAGLTDDDHTGYARLAGRSGGQTLKGGTGSGDDLTLESTSHATKGDVLLNPNGGNVAVNTTALTELFTGYSGQDNTTVEIRGGATSDNTELSVLSLAKAQSGTGNVVALLSFANSAVGSAEKRLAQFTAWTDGATNTGRLDFALTNAGTIAAVLGLRADGRVAVGPSAPAASAKLDIQGTNGALLLPRLTTTQRNALTATNGMVVYDSTIGALMTYQGGAWRTAGTQYEHTVRVTGVAGTAVELLPTGTVSNRLYPHAIVVASDGSTSVFNGLPSGDPGSAVLEPGSGDATMYNDGGTDVLVMRVNAGGSVDVRRTAGSRTYTVLARMMWL